MRLYELINKFTNDEILKEIDKRKMNLFDIYEESNNNLEYYKIGIKNIKNVTPVLSNNILCSCLYLDYNRDYYTDKIIYNFQENCFLLNKEGLDKNDIEKTLENRYAIDDIDWDELLGSYIFLNEENSEIDFVTQYCLEMMFHGNSEKEVKDFYKQLNDILKKQIEDIKSGKEKTYSFEHLYDVLEQDAKKEGNNESIEFWRESKKKHCSSEYEEYRQENRNACKKCVEYNKKEYEKLIKEILKKDF